MQTTPILKAEKHLTSVRENLRGWNNGNLEIKEKESGKSRRPILSLTGCLSLSFSQFKFGTKRANEENKITEKNTNKRGKTASRVYVGIRISPKNLLTETRSPS